MPYHLIVKIPLSSTHSTPDYHFALFRQLGLDIFLEAPKEERSEHCVKLFQDFLTDWKILLKCLLEWDVEPFVEVIERVKNARHEEVQERP